MIKKIIHLIVVAFVAVVFAGCSSDYVYVSSYVYVNGSSRDITVESYYDNGSGVITDSESVFTIHVGESHSLRFVTDAGFENPFLLVKIIAFA